MMPDKKQVMLHLMEDAWVYVQLDPRREGVAVPEWFRSQPRLVLQYGFNMPVPIADLKVDERGISATLSFRQTPFATFVPWAAVFAMSDGDKRGMVWEEDVPKDLALEEEAAGPAPAAKPAPASAPAPAAKPGAPGKKPRPSHLKLVD